MGKGIHLPGLNGLRAIAALSVVCGHTFHPVFGDWGVKGFSLSQVDFGVTLFFVISGFLITYLLINEQQQSRDVNVPKFYMRRILRIWPLYFLYMVLALLITGTGRDQNIWYYCFFTANIPFIMSVGILPIVHYWSIGVEEQFYLFWPWLVKMTKGRTRRLFIMAFVLCCSWLLCKCFFYFWGDKGITYRFFAVTRFDCMMIGAMGSILYYQKNIVFMKVVEKRWVGLMGLVLLVVSQFWMNAIPTPIRPQVIALLSLLAIMGQLANKPIVNLENRFCDFIGKISYGIYVVHPVLIILLSGAFRKSGIQLPSPWGTIAIYLGVALITCGVAWLSYRFVEKPFLKMKNKFAIVQSQNSMIN